MSVVEEGVFVPDDALLVLLVTSVDAFQDLFLDFGRVDVLGNGSNDLSQQYSTLIA